MNDRHRTIWFKSVGTPGAGKRALPEEAALNPIKRQKSESIACEDGCHEQDPWTVYKQRAVVFCGRYVALAHHQEHQSKIVHIESLSIDRPDRRYLLQTVERLSHESFLNLIEAYYYENRLFLVWEPVELSVREILDSRVPINEAQLAQIILPILQGIVFLRDKGRALAKLNSKAILLNKDGVVRVAGAEHSCQIQPSEMNCDTLKLTALAAIMADLMDQKGSRPIWSSLAKKFLRDLTTKRLDELLEHSFLKEAGGADDLVLCVSIAHKIASYNIKEVNNV